MLLLIRYQIRIIIIFYLSEAENDMSEERDKVTSLYNRLASEELQDAHVANRNLSSRRRSAPGWVNVSLLYPPSPVASDGEDTMIHHHLSRNQHSPSRTPPVRGASPHRNYPMGYHPDAQYPGWISPRRSRLGRHASPIRATPGDESPRLGRSKRSMSLPLPDPTILEIGEAVGAIASISPEHGNTSLKHAIGKRGRCMSIEESSLEAILEDGGMSPRINTVRRLSVPTHPIAYQTAMNS